MDIRSAILAFSQSEKIKAGLIWATQTLEIDMGLSEQDKAGAEKIIQVLVKMVANEIHVAMKVAPHEHWDNALKHINNAVVMIHSKVAHDAPYHLSRSISHVTSIGQAAMDVLADKDLV